MAVQMLPQDVADAFVKQYYAILNKCPENVHKFYQESSVVGWPGPDGDVTPVTTLDGISEKVMSSDYKYCSVDVITIDAQESIEGGVLVGVTGSLTTQLEVKKNFNQIFFLAKQPKGFYVLNDILRSVDVVEPISESVAKDGDKNDYLDTSLKTLVVNDGDKNDDLAVSMKTLVSEKPEPAVAVVPEIPDSSFPPIKDTIGKKASAGSLEKAKSDPPVSAVKVEAPKITYASVLARTTPVTSPKATSDVRNQPTVSKTAKASPSLVDGAQKASNAMSKTFVSPRKETLTSQTAKNAASNQNAAAEVKGIYIGRLPYDITRQGIADVVKKFGPIKRSADNIQIRRHEDGFCCGFVEFESVDSARRAVEAHYVMFGDKEAYITFKKSSYNRNDERRGRSPPRGGGARNGNFRGRDDNDGGAKNGRGGNNKGQVWDQSYRSSSNRKNRVSSDRWSRDGRS